MVNLSDAEAPSAPPGVEWEIDLPDPAPKLLPGGVPNHIPEGDNGRFFVTFVTIAWVKGSDAVWVPC